MPPRAPSEAPLVSSPSKRVHRSSPTSSPITGAGSFTEATSPRVLRTKLADGADELRLELPPFNDLERFRLRRDGPGDAGETTVTTPSTPPEFEPEPLVGLGVGLAGEVADEAVKVDGDEAYEGATQTATAERQNQELEALPHDEQTVLARLCSQHWASQYNMLKRTLAAAANPAAYAGRPVDACPPPAPPCYPLTSFTPPANRSATPTLHDRSVTPAYRTAPDSACLDPSPRKRSETPWAPPTPPSSTSGAGATALTPSLANFTFNFAPSSLPPCPPAPEAEVEGVLCDLIQGEPVSIQQTQSALVITETVPALDAAAVPDVPSAPPPADPIPGLLPGMIVVNGVPVKTSASHPINISPLVTPELLAYLSSHLYDRPSPATTAPIAMTSARSLTPAPFLLRSSVSTDLLSVTAAYEVAPDSLPHTIEPAPPVLGNFVLSSCPGKKVRMNGEALKGGRGAICRDVVVDLQRARDEYNVHLVVCCLDDSELAYLGVPWPEYRAAAASLGLEVVRLPMVEGFAPAGAAQLDAHLARIVCEYTLRGKSVLAHCRGGIGRAGLVASCWMLKTGLVAVAESEGGAVDEAVWAGEEPMRIVERVIELIRRRRSIKAIETPQQVHFLVQYATWLQQHAELVSASDLVAPLS
ncbi:hypothetical protein Rhopal_005436-T1 [Rhodotorula paludigena]|uniref:Tyrosine specific protein phosphatases domain-containing protein n=1 Tax=Rhodotorula paludigena TaxID=86838 RepID=A0AAV5GIJ8_9BASI|nr:hypothetical protein Rhopal_005436-T1 [Rhodotorula paludigena]